MLGIAALVYIAQPVWLPVVMRWQYWAMLRAQPASKLPEPPAALRDPRSATLPVEFKLLDDGAWATPEAPELLMSLRRAYPKDAAVLDYYLACWRLWNGEVAAAEAEFRRLGRELPAVPMAQVVLRVGSEDEWRMLGRDWRAPAEARVEAWHRLAQSAAKRGRSREAADYRLNALEIVAAHHPLPRTAQTTVDALKREIRRDVWGDCHRRRLRGILREWIKRADDPRVVEELVFELGKVETLARLEPAGKERP